MIIMNLVDFISDYDKQALSTYFKYYNGGIRYVKPESMNYYLRDWAFAKKDLYAIFGNQFILEKEVEFSKGFEELVEDLTAIVWEWSSLSRKFIEGYRDTIYEIRKENCELYFDLDSLISDMVLVKNQYDGDTFSIPAELTKSGKKLVIQKGCKAVKAIKKVAEELDCLENYEEFRQAHSQVLNQKKIRGTICLSIHPLDYITISDNDYGWGSCMSWTEEPGDYRVGTLEMMNSDCVVVAYLKGNENGGYLDGMWNNKKWRQLILVTPSLILGNKQYPYQNDELQGFCLMWLRQLCEKAEFGKYFDEAHQIKNNCSNIINGTHTVNIRIHSKQMYNDVYDTRLAYIGKAMLEKDNYYLNFSGDSICTGCGEYLSGCDDTNMVVCPSCDGRYMCACCGEYFYGEPEYQDDSGRCYCSWCEMHERVECEVCGCTLFSNESIVYPIVLKPTPEHPVSNGCLDYYYSIRVCEDCIDTEDFVKKFGKIHEIESGWTFKRVIYLEDITDEGLEEGCLSPSAIEKLKAIRDAETREEKNKIWYDDDDNKWRW